MFVVNSDFECSPNTMTFKTSYMFKWQVEQFSRQTVKETITISSTMQVEFLTYYEATIHAILLKHFLLRLSCLHRPYKDLL